MSPDIEVAQWQPLLFLFRAFLEKRIQMAVDRIHFRPPNGLGAFRREALDLVHPALAGSKPL